MSTSIYLINPASDFPTYFSADSYAARGLPPATLIADLATPTLGAMAPPDVDVELCDQAITPIDWDTPAPFVGITGKITQYEHMVDVAREFKKRGKTIVIGGPYASLSPDAVREHCDILVRGEVEDIAGQLFSDLRNRTWKDEYHGTQPNLATSPVPRWDLYRLDRAVMGTLQTSRGCPFECEFCDVIQYVGRKQRHKQVAQVLRELDELYRHGLRTVFLADDNFTAYRSRAKELLVGIRDWNRRQTQGKVSFLTQVSIDAAKDDELLGMCAEAGLVTVFIGIETPNEDSLRETKKRQNLHLDLVEQVARFFEYGIHVIGGMIVGFDADGPDIFEKQLAFAMAAGIPIVSVGALVAPNATPLHERMQREGRLKSNRSEVAGAPWSTNIIHPRFSDEELSSGLKWLCNNLYSPAAFAERLLTFIKKFGRRLDPAWGEPARSSVVRRIDLDGFELVAAVRQLGPEEDKMVGRVVAAAAGRPEVRLFVVGAFLQYMQVRHMYDRGRFWEPQLAAGASRPTSPVPGGRAVSTARVGFVPRAEGRPDAVRT